MSTITMKVTKLYVPISHLREAQGLMHPTQHK